MKRILFALFLALAASNCWASRDLEEDQAVVIVVGPFVDSTGAAVTAPTIASIDITAFKNDGTAVGITPAASGSANDMVHVDDGFFSLEVTATDTSTPGYLRLCFQISGGLIFFEDFNILPANIYDSKYGADKLQVDLVEIAGSAVSTSTAQLGVNVVNAAGTAWGSGAITAASIASDAIGAAEVAAGAIAADAFASGAIDATAIAADAIGASELAANSITSSEVADDSIDAGAIAASAIGASEVASSALVYGTEITGTFDADVVEWLGTAAATPTTAGVPEVDVTFVGGTAAATALLDSADVTTAVDASDVATEVTAILDDTGTSGVVIANDAITAAKIQASAIGASEIADAAIDEATYATTAGPFDPLQIVDQGTAQSATGTTLVLRSAAAFANDELLGAYVVITGGTGVGQTRQITDYVSSTDTATVATWTTTPSGTITYQILPGVAGAGGEVSIAAGGISASSFASGAIDAAAIATNAIAAGTEFTGTVDANVASMDAGAIDSAAFGTGAITANAIASSAIANGTEATGFGTAQTGDGYAIVSSGTHGNAALKTLIDTVDDLIDTEVGAIKTKTDFLPSATAGASGGLFIAGTNAATTVTTSFTTTFTGSLTGNVNGNVGGNVTGSVGSLVGHTVQTGDSYALVNSGTFGLAIIEAQTDDIGAAGAGLTALATQASVTAGFAATLQENVEYFDTTPNGDLGRTFNTTDPTPASDPTPAP